MSAHSCELAAETADALPTRQPAWLDRKGGSCLKRPCSVAVRSEPSSAGAASQATSSQHRRACEAGAADVTSAARKSLRSAGAPAGPEGRAWPARQAALRGVLGRQPSARLSPGLREHGVV